MRRSFQYVFLMLVCHSLASAQISRPGTPQGLNNQMLNTEVPFVKLPPHVKKPYLLSANHCHGNASTLVVMYNWQGDTCANPAESPPYHTMSGAVTRARNSASDFWLVELNQAVPTSYQPFFAGWIRSLADSLEGELPGIYIVRVVSGVYVGEARIIKR